MLIVIVTTFIISVLDVIGLAAIVPIILIVSDSSSVKTNVVLSYIFNIFDFSSIKTFILFLLVALLIFFLVKNIIASYILSIQTKFISEISSVVVESQLNIFSNMPLWQFNNFGSSTLLNNTLQIPSNYINGVIRPLFALVNELIIVVIIVLVIFISKPVLFVALVVFLVPSILIMYKMLKNRSQKVGQEVLKLRPISYNYINDIFSGFLELKLADKYDKFKENFSNNSKRIYDLESKAYIYQALPPRFIEMISILGITIIFIYGVYFSGRENETLALLGLFAAASYRLMPSINRIMTLVVMMKTYQSTVAALEEFNSVIYKEKPMLMNQKSLEFKSIISLSDICFAFPNANHYALSNINIDIRKGEIIGFIGSSGSGKTTLMNLLLRFYTENKGSILVDGVALEDKHLKSWYSIVGYVKQDTFLMDASIKDNITLKDETVDEERLLRAIKQASLMTFVSSLPDRENTIIGEKGSMLSGGQRQRIGIARALYKKAEILILDEATSALDNETEREVNEAIHSLSLTDITILIVAHRITTLRDCDRIYELKNGEIMAAHQYNDLVDKIIQ